ncbi:MAG: NAD-dependent epimerase/dehydratase family protein [Nitrospirae bacterium]|nr:NAD-dependent epimerase/dehydratase family protein [Nitrospirota bacterium]
MKIFVTGGTGFTGSHLTRRLLLGGHKVMVLDNQPGRYYEELIKLGAEIHIGSVADRDLVFKLTEGCEIVHHVAAMFRRVNLSKSIYWDVNVEGTRYVFEAALKYGVRKVVNCSTCGVHGHIHNTPASEDAPIAPEDYYQYTKYEGEKIIPEFLDKGLKVVTLRPTAIYGPGDPERFAMLYREVKKGRFYMFGSGESHYHPLFVDNLVDAFEVAAASDKEYGEVYLIADEQYSTLNNLVTKIGEALGVDLKIHHMPFWPLWTAAFACEMVYKPFNIDPPLFRRRVDWFRQNRAFSIEKAKKEIGYKPLVGLEEGLKRTGEWYEVEGLI